MEMQITFPGGKRVSSHYKGFTVETDQSKSDGGDGTAPAPFDLFLASIGTCAGIYVALFCESRNLSTEGISLTLRFQWNEKKHRMEKINITINLPSDFPERYRKPIVRTAEMCTVKRALADPPEIVVSAAGAE